MTRETLSALIQNFNTDCHKQYTQVSSYLGDRLDESLKEIERFYYSKFWEDRFIKRLEEENLPYWPIELDRIQGITTCLREDTIFKLYDADFSQNGVSNKGTMIGLNTNLDSDEINDSHINNVIMHEFGHRQYNQSAFNIVKDLNKKVIGTAGLHIKNSESLTESDYPYFTNDNELRQRIIPIIKEMYDNGWSLEQTYELSNNLKIDDIKDIFTKEFLITLIKNLL